MAGNGGKTVLVTGAAGGIGLAVCRHLAGSGWRVVATAHPSESVTELERVPVARVARVDLLDDEDVAAFVRSLESESRWDALVSNAGISVPGPVEAIPIELLRRQLEVNTIAPIRLTQALLPALRARRGRVVYIGAGQGRVALPFGGPYGASKAALAALADALRAELDGSGVTVSVVEPGAVRTGILRQSRINADQVLDAMPAPLAARYRDRLAGILARSEAAFQHAVPPEDLAALVARVLQAASPRPRYLFGRDARGLAAIALLPASVRARLVARVGRAG